MSKQLMKKTKRPSAQQSKQSAVGSIRLIAGKHRGRKLPVIMAQGLRPTTDRVKETVFNWLMPYIHNSRCLDCFAGSGSLGFEALSRGASEVTLLELNKQASAQLNQNKVLLNADNLTIHHTDSLSYLKNPSGLYNIVFIDPPFNQGLIEETVSLINNGWLAEKALIYVEMENQGQFQFPQDWLLLKENVAGQVAYRLFEKTA